MATQHHQTRKKKSNPAKTWKKKCHCGKFHLYADCYYVTGGPRGWKPDATIQKAYEERLEKDYQFKRAINRAKKLKDQQNKSGNQSKEQHLKKDDGLSLKSALTLG